MIDGLCCHNGEIVLEGDYGPECVCEGEYISGDCVPCGFEFIFVNGNCTHWKSTTTITTTTTRGPTTPRTTTKWTPHWWTTTTRGPTTPKTTTRWTPPTSRTTTTSGMMVLPD